MKFIYQRIKYETQPNQTVPIKTLKIIINHLIFHQSDKMKIKELKITIAIDKRTNHIHHLIVLLFVFKNLEFPEPPNEEYLPKNIDLNQWIKSSIFPTKDHIINTKGNNKLSIKLKFIFATKIALIINIVKIDEADKPTNTQNKILSLKA